MPASARAWLQSAVRRLAAPLLWAALIAQAALLIYLFRPWWVGDTAAYAGLADSLAHGGYGLTTALGYEPDPLRPPGYPVLLWFFLHLMHLPQLAVVVVQVGIYIVILYALQRFMQRRGLPGELLLALALVYPFGLAFVIPIATEAWAMLGLTAVALLLARERLGWPTIVAIGLVCGASALVRADMLLLPFEAAVIIAVKELRGIRKPGAAVARSTLPIVVTGLILLPYALWNQANFGRLSPVPQAGAVGTSLYLASWQRRVPLDVLTDTFGDRRAEAEQAGLATEIRALNRQVGAPAETSPWDPAKYPTAAEQIEMTHVFGKRGMERLESDPAYYARHVVLNLWDLWNTTHYPPRVPAIGIAALTIVSALVYFLGLAGMVLVIVKRRSSPIPWAVVPIALYPMAIHLWLHTEARYTAEARPLLMMFAAAFLAEVAQRILPAPRRAQRAAAASIAVGAPSSM